MPGLMTRSKAVVSFFLGAVMLAAAAQVYAADRTISANEVIERNLTIPAGDTYTFESGSRVTANVISDKVTITPDVSTD